MPGATSLRPAALQPRTAVAIVVVAVLLAAALAGPLARRYRRWTRTTLRAATIHHGMVNQATPLFAKFAASDRYLPLELVPRDRHLAVALPPVPVRDPRFKSYNPGVFVVGERLFSAVRVGSYTLEAEVRGELVSECFLYDFTNNRYRHVDLPETPARCKASGFEDVRALVHGDVVYLVATSFTAACTNSMFLIRLRVADVLDGAGPLRPLSVTRLVPDPRLPGAAGRQKNWMPFVHDGDLHFVYSVDPHVVLRCDADTGECSVVGATETLADRGADAAKPQSLAEARGGSNAVRVGDVYVAFVHTTRPLLYDTYAYAFEAAPPFRVVSFPGRQIFWARVGDTLPYVEFTSGLAVLERPEGRFWVVSFGQNDARPMVAIMTEAHGLRLLE